LSGEKLDAIYSSDLSRAVDTAKTIGEHHGLEVVSMAELKETNFGEWEGKTYPEIEHQFRALRDGWRDHPMETKIPGGESLGEVHQRCWAGINKIISENRGKNVLAVVHGGIIRLTVATVLGMKLGDYWKIRQDNVSLNIIEFFEEDRAIVCLLNDINHLK
jgi:broad specificity phosphatase PhoE